MLNYWWVTRPKRKLVSIPEVVATLANAALNIAWEGQRGTHLSLEAMLEQSGLKRAGERRDQTGGGARTYAAWVASLGLTFVQESTKELKLTLAGEALLAGESPVRILKHQILKYQFPSSYSLSRNVGVSERFKIRPFRFLLRLLYDSRIGYLTEEEIAKIIITEAENESDACLNYIIKRIEAFRNDGDACLENGFLEKYSSGKGENTFSRLKDIANTIVNWIEYTQLVAREDGKVFILDEKMRDVEAILSSKPPFIDRPHEQEYFQRKYGVDPRHIKDTRNMTQTKTITPVMIAELYIRRAFIAEALRTHFIKITTDIVDKISEQTGILPRETEEILSRLYPRGAVGGFMSYYSAMAFNGRDEATDFERATVQLFENVFGFEAHHVGTQKMSPDVFILSDNDGYIGIIDNKAYHKYTITNDHRNRMVHNYIKAYSSGQKYPLAFFSYIAGGFCANIDSQIKSIVAETSVKGSAVSVFTLTDFAEKYIEKSYGHSHIRELFSLNRQILLQDI